MRLILTVRMEGVGLTVIIRFVERDAVLGLDGVVRGWIGVVGAS